MKPKKDQWVDEVLNSIKDTERANPQPFLFRKIIDRIEEKRVVEAPVGSAKIWKTAFAFIFLLFFNVFGIVQNFSSGQDEDSMEIVAEDYELLDQDNVYAFWE